MRRLGVSAQAVCVWHRHWDAEGVDGLRRRRAPGFQPWLVRAQARLRHHAERTDELARLSREAIAEPVESLGDIVTALAEADPVDKAEVYRQLGLQLTYHPETQTAYAEIHLGVRRLEMVRVRGGT